MKSTSEELFKNMSILYQNIYSLMIGMQEATNSNFNDIEVELKNIDGTTEKVKVNSFQKLQNELTRIDNNFKSLVNGNNLSYFVGKDGSITQVAKSTFMNAEYLSKFKIESNECIIDKTSIINQFIFPSVKIPIILDSNIKTDIRCYMYDVESGFENIKDTSTLVDMEYLIQNSIITATSEELSLKLEKDKVRFYGNFSITNIKSYENNVYTLTVDDVKYSNVSLIGKSTELKVGDNLITKTGNSSFEITYVDVFNKTLKLQRIGGSELLQTGTNNLQFNAVIDSDTNIVGIPVKPNKKLAIFLSVENLSSIGYPSTIIKIDTSEYQVSHNKQTYTLDEYFSKFVTNFSEYLLSLIKETSIPFSLGIKPDKPLLDLNNFKVLQINKHLSDNKSDSKINDLNKSKSKIKTDIDYKQSEIDNLQNEVDTLKFKSLEEKEYRINKIISLRNDISVLNKNLLTITREIDSNAIEYGLKKFKPKYKCIGFWNIQDLIYSPLTKPQQIVKYDVQYRYLSKNIDTLDTTTMKIVDNGKTINVAFSNWNEFNSRSLNKVTDFDGELVWETPILDSIDDININQCMISINEGESLEIRVRSVSEAGYPIAPLKSEWSDIIRIEFPDNISDSNVVTIVSSNENDLLKSEFNSILQNSGVISHLSGTIKESEKIFYHSANNIASGFYTAEQKNIPLDVFLQSIRKDVDILKNIDSQNNISVELIDFKNEKYVVKNNTTMEINAGNYADNLNLFDTTKFGSIVVSKAYIKILNNNNIPIEINTLVPGNVFDLNIAPNYFNVPGKFDTQYIQKSKSIIYFRNVDLTGQQEDIFKLIKPTLTDTTTDILPINIDNTASEENKNIVYFDGTTVKTCKLKTNATNNFIALTKDHPLYDAGNSETIKPVFNRIKKYTSRLKEDIVQNEASSNTSNFGFDQNDMYLVGENSCGAYFYPVISNVESFQVIGNTTISTKIVPANSEIVIPIVFEYRMMDRTGYVNGTKDMTINDELKYIKKIGIDLFINKELFKFDVIAYSNLKSKVQTVDGNSLSSIVGAYKNENKEILS